MIVPGDAGEGDVHTKQSERPDPDGIGTTANIELEANFEFEANLGAGSEENLEEGPTLGGRALGGFKETGEITSKLGRESTENLGGSKVVMEGIKTGVRLDENEREILGTDSTLHASQPNLEHRGEGDGREEEASIDFEEVSRLLLQKGESCETDDKNGRTAGAYEDDPGASCSLEVPKCANPRPPSQASQAPPKTSARPRPNKLLPPLTSPPAPPPLSTGPPPPLSGPSGPPPPTRFSKSSYSAVPMAGLPLAGAVCGLCLGGPVVSECWSMEI